MAKSNKTKKHTCKKCDKDHVEDIGIYSFSGFVYRKEESGIYIHSLSIYKILREIGMKEHAVRFMDKIIDLNFKKE